MKKSISLLLVVVCTLLNHTRIFAQGVGINATGAAPDNSAMLHIDVGSSTTMGLLITGPSGGGALPDLGAGSRLMFYPGKGAFRAGSVSGTQWNNINVGLSSVAIGNNTIASGTNATALGIGTIAGGNFSTAMGNTTVAFGVNSTTMGYNTFAAGTAATAMGNSSIAAGANSTAIGSFAAANGTNSIAMGSNTNANGNNSTAMGSFVSTNTKTGAFIIGDALGTGVMSSADNEMTMGFSGGYRLFSNTASNLGVLLNPNGNAWVSISDVNRKENFETLNGEEVLEKMSKINFTSWNYKQQDPKIYRHYGIMAQDFYKAFGHDSFGTVGNDTTVNPIDMIGIDMTSIQALEKRTADLKNENETLKASVAELQKKFTEQQILIENLITRQKKHIKKRTF